MEAEIADVFAKLGNKALHKKDLEDFLMVLRFLANQSLLIQDEIYGWDRALQFNLDEEGKSFYITTQDPFSDKPDLIVELGQIDSPTITINTNADTLTGLMCGRVDMSELNEQNWKQEGAGMEGLMIFIILTILGQELEKSSK